MLTDDYQTITDRDGGPPIFLICRSWSFQTIEFLDSHDSANSDLAPPNKTRMRGYYKSRKIFHTFTRKDF